MKKFLFFPTAFFIILVALVFYGLYFGSDAREGEINRKNSHKVRIGMTKNQVLAIMGNPIRKTVYDNRTIYEYNPAPTASSGIGISLGKDSTVVHVGHGED